MTESIGVPPQMAQTKALFIEDSRIDQMIFSRAVARLNLPLEFEIAGSVQAALESLAARPVDVIISDYYLEDGTALDILAKVTRTPVIVVTGAGEADIAVQAMKSGAYDYLTKDAAGDYLKLLPLAITNAIRRKRAEEQSRVLSHALTNIHDSVFITDLNNIIFFVNNSLCRSFGFSEAELIGRQSMLLYSAENEPVHPIKCPVRDVYLYCLRKDRTRFPVMLSKSYLIDERGEPNGVIGVLRDMTEIRQIEIAKNELEAQLRQAQKLEAIGQLAGGIAHDFNNILGSIIGYSEMTVEDVPKSGLAHSNLLEVLKAAQRARNLVEQILTFSRSNPSAHGLRAEIPELIDEVINLFEPQLPSGILFRKELSDDLPPIAADPARIHQIITNLCSNALHAMRGRRGEILVSATLEDSSAEVATMEKNLPAGAYVRIVVRDNGCGIPPETIQRIFDPFFTTKAVGEGTGLGLSIIHGIVSDLKGGLRVESALDEGTTFEIFVPVGQVTEEFIPADEGKWIPAFGRVLLVDDDERLARAGKQMLERMGYQVTMCSSSVDALEMFKKSPDAYDLVVTDQTMPAMTGDNLGAQIRELNPNIPMIICTGYSQTIDRDSAKRLGFYECLRKPVRFKELQVAVSSALESCGKGVLSGKA